MASDPAPTPARPSSASPPHDPPHNPPHDPPHARPRSRDRRGRGMRGPGVLPRVPGRPGTRSRAERFDDLVLALVTGIEERWHDRLGLVEYAVEDAPLVDDGWGASPVPLATLVRGSGGRPARIVLFRRPLEHRAVDRPDLQALVHAVLVEQVGALLGIEPSEVDPRYRPEWPED